MSDVTVTASSSLTGIFRSTTVVCWLYNMPWFYCQSVIRLIIKRYFIFRLW